MTLPISLRTALHVALALAAISATTAQAQIYQYKDASGKMIISDRPPAAGTAASKTRVYATEKVENSEAATDGTAPTTPKTLAEREMDFKKRQQEKQAAAEKERQAAADKAAHDENCARARRQLQTLESGERITSRDEKGERVFMEENQRTAETERARKYIAENCK